MGWFVTNHCVMWTKRISQRQCRDLRWLAIIDPKQAYIGVITTAITPDMKDPIPIFNRRANGAIPPVPSSQGPLPYWIVNKGRRRSVLSALRSL